MIGTINLAQPHPLHAHPRDIEALLTPFTRGSCVRRTFLHSLQMPLQSIQERSSRRVSLLSFSPPEQRLVGKSQPRLHQQVHISCDTRKVSLNLDQPQAFGSEGKGGSLQRLTFVSSGEDRDQSDERPSLQTITTWTHESVHHGALKSLNRSVQGRVATFARIPIKCDECSKIFLPFIIFLINKIQDRQSRHFFK